MSIGQGVVKPRVGKVDAIHSYPVATTKKKVRAFIGLVGWYSKIIPHFGQWEGSHPHWPHQGLSPKQSEMECRLWQGLHRSQECHHKWVHSPQSRLLSTIHAADRCFWCWPRGGASAGSRWREASTSVSEPQAPGSGDEVLNGGERVLGHEVGHWLAEVLSVGTSLLPRDWSSCSAGAELNEGLQQACHRMVPIPATLRLHGPVPSWESQPGGGLFRVHENWGTVLLGEEGRKCNDGSPLLEV